MEAQAQQPFIIQTGSKVSPGTLLVGAAIVGGVGYFGWKAWKQHVADKEAEKLDTPAAQAASEIYNAKNWYGDKEEVAFAAARKIAEQKIAWKDVADSFKKAGHGNIDEYLDFLGPEEKAKFFTILNLSKGGDGKSPPGAANPFDTTKNFSLAFASGSGHIRKSPEIKGTSIQFRPFVKDNIIVESRFVKAGIFLVLLTGRSKTYIGENSDQGTLFYEFTGYIIGLGNRQMWIAAQFVKVFEYKTKEVATKAIESEMKVKKNFLAISDKQYNAAT